MAKAKLPGTGYGLAANTGSNLQDESLNNGLAEVLEENITTSKESDLTKSYNNIKEYMDKYSTYGMYIHFVVGEFDYVTDKYNDYLMSLENVKSGAGKANTFTLSIAFCPNPEGSGLFDTNFIDIGLVTSTAECMYEYGYTFPDGTIVKSPAYYGRILDYTVEIRDSKIYYTITGFSSIVSLKDFTINHTSAELKELADGTYNPIKLVKGLLEEAIEEQRGNYGGDDYNVVIDSNIVECAENKDLFQDVNDEHLFEYIGDILNQTRAIGQENFVGEDSTITDQDTIEEIESLITYEFIIDDTKSSGKKTIKLISDDPNEESTSSSSQVTTSSSSTIEMTFDWMSGRNDDIVLNFQPNFSGSVAIANASSMISDLNLSKTGIKEAKDRIYTINSKGEIAKTINSIYTRNNYSPISGNSVDNDMRAAAAMISLFEKNIYTATLTTLGQPYNVEIKTRIIIHPLIYGHVHHTGGEYMVLSSRDSIGLSGFTSTYELCKIGSSTEFKKSILELYNTKTNPKEISTNPKVEVPDSVEEAVENSTQTDGNGKIVFNSDFYKDPHKNNKDWTKVNNSAVVPDHSDNPAFSNTPENFDASLMSSLDNLAPLS